MAAFDRLVSQVMRAEADLGPAAHPRELAHQVEIFFSILQRKVRTPNDYENLAVLARTLNQFEQHWNEVAEPFEWNFTRDDLAEPMDRLAPHEPELRLAA